MTKGYAVVIEGEEGSYSAYSPDLPGCIAAAQSLDEVKQLMYEAIDVHLEGLQDEGLPIPEPSAVVALVRSA